MKIIFALNGNRKLELLMKQKFDVHNFLFSFAMGKSFEATTFKLLDEKDFLIVDSGAFSAWTNNKVINIEDYISYCKRLRQNAKCEIHFVNLDKIPGSFGKRPTQNQIEESAEVGWKNYETMRQAGVKTIHIFHQHEDFKWLERLKQSSDYIGISPANDLSLNERIRWLKKVYTVVRNDVKTHIFGLTSCEALKQIPAYSADSSSWTSAARYGAGKFYENFKTKTFRLKDKNSCFKFKVDPTTLEANSLSRLQVNIDSILRMEKDLTALWAKRGIIWK